MEHGSSTPEPEIIVLGLGDRGVAYVIGKQAIDITTSNCKSVSRKTIKNKTLNGFNWIRLLFSVPNAGAKNVREVNELFPFLKERVVWRLNGGYR